MVDNLAAGISTLRTAAWLARNVRSTAAFVSRLALEIIVAKIGCSISGRRTARLSRHRPGER